MCQGQPRFKDWKEDCLFIGGVAKHCGHVFQSTTLKWEVLKNNVQDR